MGKIRIGRGGQGVYDPSAPKEKRQAAQVPSAMTGEEKQKFIDAVMQMPKDKQVGMLREKGLTEEADKLEQFLAEEHLKELAEGNRMRRLKEIQSLPEDEQLPLLIAEGFEDEAKELAEKLAAEKEKPATGADNATVTDNGDEGTAENAPVEEAPADAANKTKEVSKQEKPKTPKAKTPAKARPFKFDDGKKKTPKK